jgi:hypothetical protein
MALTMRQAAVTKANFTSSWNFIEYNIKSELFNYCGLSKSRKSSLITDKDFITIIFKIILSWLIYIKNRVNVELYNI